MRSGVKPRRQRLARHFRSTPRLRRTLGGQLETRAPGYLIRVQDGELDAQRFERLLAQGKHALAAGDPGRAAALLRTALELWRGPALADVIYEPFAQEAAGRLEELRLSCLEERIEADLALGRHADLVGELEVLADRHPYRERLSGRLMLALYRSERQAEALEVYRRSRDRLVDELGIEPGPELRLLASRVLNQDPSLGWTAPPASAEDVIEPTGAFVGRKRELADLHRGLDDLQQGHGSLFLISGEPGIGKTALTEQFTARVGQRHSSRLVRSLLGIWRCSGVLALGAVPARPCTRIGAGHACGPTRRSCRRPRRGSARVASTWLRPASAALRRCRRPAIPALRCRRNPLTRGGSHEAHRACPRGFARGGRGDALLLRFVAQTLTDAPLLIIATTRSSDRTVTESFTGTLAELARAQRFHDIRLGGLSRDEVADLVGVTRDVAAPDALVDMIFSRTDGHPFFVSEIAQLLATNSDLDLLPQGVRAAVSQRLAPLSEKCNELLAAAAVVGREFRIDVLATATELSRQMLLIISRKHSLSACSSRCQALRAATVSRMSWSARCCTTS